MLFLLINTLSVFILFLYRLFCESTKKHPFKLIPNICALRFISFPTDTFLYYADDILLKLDFFPYVEISQD